MYELKEDFAFIAYECLSEGSFNYKDCLMLGILQESGYTAPTLEQYCELYFYPNQYADEVLEDIREVGECPNFPKDRLGEFMIDGVPHTIEFTEDYKK